MNKPKRVRKEEVDTKRMLKFFVALDKALSVLPNEEKRRVINALVEINR